MTDLEKAARQALVALEKIASYRPLTFAECSDAEAVMGIAEKAIPALREALAEQPAQQEPVAWLDEYGNASPLAAKQYSVVGKHWKPLYTSPPQRKPLTDDAIWHKWVDARSNVLMFSRAIEAAHGIKEKNT